MSDQSAKVVAWLGEQRQAMIDLLETLVNVDSGSYDKQGTDAAGQVLKDFFAARGIPVEAIPNETYGDALRASVAHPGGANTKPIVLMGHRDTVFPKGEAARRPFTIKGDRAYGPGVADMKAGLVINAFVLAGYHALGGHPSELVALITADEEIASPFSRKVIEREARAARIVLNSEPGRASGNVVSGRKGGVFMRFEVTGRAAHSGANHGDGRSAIEEIAHKIVALHKLTGHVPGATVNVGLVSGGQTVNTVAPYASGEIDLRYVKLTDRAVMLDAIAAVIARCTVPDTSATWEIKGEFLAMEMSEPSKALLDLYIGGAAELGMTIGSEFTGGSADSGVAAAQGTPTLCGLGAVGGKVHGPEEYIEVDSIVPRAQALARVIGKLNDSPL